MAELDFFLEKLLLPQKHRENGSKLGQNSTILNLLKKLVFNFH